MSVNAERQTIALRPSSGSAAASVMPLALKVAMKSDPVKMVRRVAKAARTMTTVAATVSRGAADRLFRFGLGSLRSLTDRPAPSMTRRKVGVLMDCRL